MTQITKDYSYNINVSKFKPVLYLSTVKSNHKLEMPDRVTSLFRSEEKTYSLHKVVLIDPLNCCWTWQQLSSLSLSAIQSFVSLSFFFFLNWNGDVCQDPVNPGCALSSNAALRPDYGNNRNRVTRAGKVNLRRQRVGSAAEEIDFGVYCPAICHTKPLL